MSNAILSQPPVGRTPRLSLSTIRFTEAYRDALFAYGHGSITWTELLKRYRSMREAFRAQRRQAA